MPAAPVVDRYPCCARRLADVGRTAPRRRGAQPGPAPWQPARLALGARSGLRRRRQLAGPAAPGLPARTPDGPGAAARALPPRPVCPGARLLGGDATTPIEPSSPGTSCCSSPCSRPSWIPGTQQRLAAAMWQWLKPAAPSSGMTSSSTTRRSPTCAACRSIGSCALFPRGVLRRRLRWYHRWRAPSAACTRRSTPSSTRCHCCAPTAWCGSRNDNPPHEFALPFLPFAFA